MSAASGQDRTRDDAASRRLAVFLTLIAMLFFASQDALTRLLVREYPVAQVVATGTARPKAQGQVMISTATAISSD